MALRLAGEEFSVLQGLDDKGWLRRVQPGDSSSPGLKIKTPSLGDIALALQGAFRLLYADDGETLRLTPTAGGVTQITHLGGDDALDFGLLTSALKLRTVTGGDKNLSLTNFVLDARRGIVNLGAAYDGRVYIADELEVAGPLKLATYTQSSKPAAGVAGRVIYVSDASAGSKFQGDDGASWVSLG